MKRCPCFGQQFDQREGLWHNLLQNPHSQSLWGLGEALGQHPRGNQGNKHGKPRESVLI